MTASSPCSQCGDIERMWFRSDTQQLCQRCYQRRPEQTCETCGKGTRAASGTPVQCRSCRIEASWVGVTCFRCGRIPEKNARHHLDDGRSCCSSCKQMVAAPTACAYCGEMGRKRARDFALGFTEPACRRCTGKRNGFINCASCHRPRRPAGERDAKTYCEQCLPTGQAPMIKCRVCRKSRPGYTQDTCEDCAWERSHQHLVGKLGPAFKTDWARALFESYHREARLKSKRGRWRVALKRDVLFFLALEKVFDRAEDLSAVLVVRRLGGDAVRKYRRAMSFLAHTGWVVLDEDPDYQVELAIDALRRVTQHPSPWIAALLSRFLTYLLNRRQRVPHRDRPTRTPTKRKSLEFAVLRARRLLEFAQNGHSAGTMRDITQEVLDFFLAQNKECRLGVAAFIRYANGHEKLFKKLKLPSTGAPAIPAKLILPEARRLALIATLCAVDHPKETRWALIGLFNLIYAQMAHTACRMKLDQVRETEDGFQVRFAKTWLDLDPLVVPVLRRWLALRREVSAFEEAGQSLFLFPGMRSGTHINPAGGEPFRKRYGLRGRQGRTTALATLIRNGLTHARLLTDCFGISPIRAHQYCTQLSARDMGAAGFISRHHGQR